MTARTGVTEGLRTGAFLAMGIGAGAVVWAAAALFGLGIVFAAAPSLLWALKIGGAAYLITMQSAKGGDFQVPVKPDGSIIGQP